MYKTRDSLFQQSGKTGRPTRVIRFQDLQLQQWLMRHMSAVTYGLWPNKSYTCIVCKSAPFLWRTTLAWIFGGAEPVTVYDIVGKCMEPPVYENAVHDGNASQKLFPLGTQLTYRCKTGFQGDGVFTATCGGNDGWIGPSIKCLRK
jgi:Sushi repeat (SCR repeat)